MTAPVLLLGPVSDAELAALEVLGKVRFPSGPELVEAFVMLPRLVEEAKRFRHLKGVIALTLDFHERCALPPTPAEDRTPTLPETPRARRVVP